ncbi:MAG: pyridoxal phosphate-dependent aminotransferase [Deltaproteobacteria bacterium]|nr:pyridoxal phosphate-dependent aminotransferase [Deltaproteobacteria bacterium]
MEEEVSLISSRVQRLQPSATLEVADQVMALKAKGVEVIDLGVGEPDFITPRSICQAAEEAMEKGFTKYSPVAGFMPLREAAAEFLRSYFGLPYEPSHVMISSGAKQAVFNALTVCLNPGDEVILISPYWVTYPQQVEFLGGIVRVVRTREEEEYRFTAEQLEEKINSRTKVIILNSPSNPTGVVYDRTALEVLASVMMDHPRLLVISDDIYCQLLYDNRKPVHMGEISPEIFSRIITIGGMSKSYAMTGWRIGYAAGPREIISAMISVQSQVTSGANSIAQMASLFALKNGEKEVRRMKEEFEVRRNFGYALLKEIPGIRCIKPGGAFYFFPKCSEFFGMEWRRSRKKILSSLDLCEYLLHEAGVAVISGDPFGGPDHIRISYAADRKVLKEGLGRIKEALAQLK